MPPKGQILKSALAAGRCTRGLWITLEAASITEIAVELGFDWVCIDAEHGHLDFRDLNAHIAAARAGQSAVLVRIAEIQQGLIKRVLDLGADGIIVPQVTGPEDVAAAIRFAKYPPWGARGIGAERATAWGTRLKETTATANDDTLVIPLIETVAACKSLDAILDLKGIDALFVGPADLSASSGYAGEWEGPGVAAQVLAVQDRAAARGLACGVMATSRDDALRRRAEGFKMIGVATDTGLILRGARDLLAALDG